MGHLWVYLMEQKMGSSIDLFLGRLNVELCDEVEYKKESYCTAVSVFSRLFIYFLSEYGITFL